MHEAYALFSKQPPENLFKESGLLFRLGLKRQAILDRILQSPGLGALIFGELVGHVIFKNIAHVAHRLLANLFGDHMLYIVEPYVGVIAPFSGGFSEARDPVGTSIIGGKGEQVAVELIKGRVAEVAGP